MLRPKFYITITNQEGQQAEFDFCNYFETDESFEHLTDTAKVTIPRELTQDGINLFTGSNPIFKRRDKIKIESGYFPNRETLFEGFISHVSANIPVQLECEDYMFVMKSYTITYPKQATVRTTSISGKPLKYPRVTSENIKLKGLIDWIFSEGEYLDLLDGITYEIVDNVELGQVRFSNMTPAQCFDKLRDDFGLTTYFVGTKLYIGFGNNAVSTKEAEYVMEEVCINSNEMDYQEARDVRIKIKCVGMLPDNTRVEAEAGDVDGEQRTYHYYNISDRATMVSLAEQRVKDQKYTGFRGEFETFGEPRLNHGDRCKIVSYKLPERNGTYLIKGVKRRGGVDVGYRQVFDLGEKIA